MMKNCIYNFRAVLQMLRRDSVAYVKRFRYQIVNAIVIYPVTFTTTGVVIQSNTFFDAGNVLYATNLFAAAVALPLFVLCVSVMSELLFDLDKNRFINYQMTILPAPMLLAQRLIVGTLLCFFCISFFYPISSLIAYPYIDMSQISWLYIYTILFFGSFCFCSYGLLAATYFTPRSLRVFWVRINRPLMILGGFWVPSVLFVQWWEPMKYLLIINPLYYFSEGTRRGILNLADCMPYSLSVAGLLILGILFFVGALIQFKRRVDYV